MILIYSNIIGLRSKEPGKEFGKKPGLINLTPTEFEKRASTKIGGDEMGGTRV